MQIKVVLISEPERETNGSAYLKDSFVVSFSV